MGDPKLGFYGNDPMMEYCDRHSVRSNPVLDKLQRDTMEKVPASIMLGSRNELQFLANLCRSIRAKKTLDIGVYTGSSSLAIAQVLPEGGKVVACDVSEKFTNFAKPYWKEAGVREKIDLRIAPAAETLESLLAAGEAGTYDFAFIDADKGNYDNYYELSLQLLRPGGIIAIDNVLWHGRVLDKRAKDADTEAIRAVNRKVHADSRVDVTMLYLGDGTTLAFKR